MAAFFEIFGGLQELVAAFFEIFGGLRELVAAFFEIFGGLQELAAAFSEIFGGRQELVADCPEILAASQELIRPSIEIPDARFRGWEILKRQAADDFDRNYQLIGSSTETDFPMAGLEAEAERAPRSRRRPSPRLFSPQGDIG